MRPCRVRPAIKDYLWGGRRLINEYDVTTDADRVAEAWMLSCHPDGYSIIDSGPHAGKPLADVLLRDDRRYANKKRIAAGFFPVLVKLIDAKENLSVQVHPDDAYARLHEQSLGKRECWYVLEADPGAVVYYGFRRSVTREEVKKHMDRPTIMSLLNRVPVQPGDAFMIEPGTIHALGAGVLVAEIQQSSTCTYRVYDYDRVDRTGQKRWLQVDRALDVMTCSAQDPHALPLLWRQNDGIRMATVADNAAFRVDVCDNAQKGIVRQSGTNHMALLLIEGRATMTFDDRLAMTADRGACIFSPATDRQINVDGQSRFLAISFSKEASTSTAKINAIPGE